MNFRLATLEDVHLLVQIRKHLLLEEGQSNTKSIDEELVNFFEYQFSNEQLVHWLVEEQGEIIASGGIQYIAFPPSYFNPQGVRGYVMNMYTHPNYRKQGIASKLLMKLIDDANEKQVRHLFLISSDDGKPLYKKYGFRENDIYMELIL